MKYIEEKSKIQDELLDRFIKYVKIPISRIQYFQWFAYSFPKIPVSQLIPTFGKLSCLSANLITSFCTIFLLFHY